MVQLVTYVDENDAIRVFCKDSNIIPMYSTLGDYFFFKS